MSRWKMMGVLMLSVALLHGCKSRQEKQKAREERNLEQAQREAKQNPDKFENSEDPPLNAETHFAAGQLNEAQGNFEGAVKQYQLALKLDPNHKGALFQLGAVYTQAKRYNDAITVWQRYLKATKNAPAAYNNLAYCYEAAGKFEEAEKTYRAGIEKDPEDKTCRLNYGLMLARRGRIADATAQLQTCCTPAEVQYNLGSVFDQQGKKQEAKAYYEKALELDPNLRDARSRLAALK